ncbi:MAG: hypothetical protein GF411_12975 [Candidatus Lokiarchaeota archaeon]|nr:hypothetical protein [Candidatus Lokiarchaeota archaeon]
MKNEKGEDTTQSMLLFLLDVKDRILEELREIVESLKDSSWRVQTDAKSQLTTIIDCIMFIDGTIQESTLFRGIVYSRVTPIITALIQTRKGYPYLTLSDEHMQYLGYKRVDDIEHDGTYWVHKDTGDIIDHSVIFSYVTNIQDFDIDDWPKGEWGSEGFGLGMFGGRGSRIITGTGFELSETKPEDDKLVLPPEPEHTE